MTESQKIFATQSGLEILVDVTTRLHHLPARKGEELREIILLLARFVRERSHSNSYHTTLYLLSLKNIVWATRLDIAKWGISELTEASFLRKLLLLVKDKVYQELASALLWGLADAYEKSNTFILSFEVDDAIATGSYFTKKIGFAVMVDNLAAKLANGRSVENDSGALSSMIVNLTSSSFFLMNYGYPPHFEVKRKVILFLVEAVFRLEDQKFLDGVAEAFSSRNNKDLFMELFESVSREIALVNVICSTLKAHSSDTFLRPMLFNFLHQIVTQDDRVNYLERKIRLDVITELLSQQLTQNELRNVVNMLYLIASKHTGVRHYLSGFASKCIPQIVSVMDGFSEYAQHNDASKILQDHTKLEDNEETLDKKKLGQIKDGGAANYFLKVTTAKAVFVSYFTEDIYEQYLRLLLLLVTGSEFSTDERYGCLCEEDGCSNCDPCDLIAKAHCGHVILRLSTAERVLCSSYNIDHLISTQGDPSIGVSHLSIQLLEALAANQQSRVQLLRGSAKLEWSWLQQLVKSVILSDCSPSDEETGDARRSLEVSAVHTIQMLGHLSAAKEVALRLTAEKSFIAILFSYLMPTDAIFAANVEVRRATSFTLARLAEYPLIVRDTFFQEKMAMLAHATMDYGDPHGSSGEQDRIVLANKLILIRNRALLTPGLQGRSADDDILSLLTKLLISNETESIDVGGICADVLAHLLYFRVNARDEKRLRSVMWRYTRAMSPNKNGELPNYPSSKRLTAYLHNWLQPMLQKLRHSSFGAFHGDPAKLLSDELAFTCKHLEQPTQLTMPSTRQMLT
ncbi:uncharacterized protein IUM83_05970 [Phytophthora cinnamomi]|uniref:uncharacterized protein n=1 Tax=Phytophthora cinnamomi TaxID=4785 RepID=UPI00355ABDB1|nr:hypothetical protein IUM83_05970 [Phytophthora cinnamomi]